MENIYKRWGIKTGINAWTWMTSIGGSIMLPEVHQAMVDAAPYFVDMQELNRKTGEIIGRYTGVEAGMVTAGCAAAMGLQMAAFSGGKGVRGPQSTGILCGRKYLIEAARLHTISGSGAITGRMEKTTNCRTITKFLRYLVME